VIIHAKKMYPSFFWSGQLLQLHTHMN